MPEPTRLQRSIRRAARHLDAIAAELDEVDVETLSGDDWLRIRARIGNLTADFNESVADVDLLLGTSGAQARILRYLQLRLGEVVTKDELSGVAGISEWARRVRELRMDHGWPIHSSVTRSNLHVGEYILERSHPDEDLAHTWTQAKRSRNLRTAGGIAAPKVRLLEYLKAIYPHPADTEQLAYVTGSHSDCSRYVEELRDEGWKVVPLSKGDASSAEGHRLASLERQI